MILETAALCMALNLYHEARSEPIMGQYAVAMVTLNRAKGERKNVCRVVLAKKQFSWTTTLVKGVTVAPSGLPKDQDAWKKAQIIANVSLSGKMPDFTNGSNFYHVQRIRPYWVSSMERTKQVGRHIFYRHHEYVTTYLSKGIPT